MSKYIQDDLTDEQVDHEAALYGDLTAAVRELVDAALRTEVADDVVRQATGEVRRVAAALREQQMPGSYGVRWSSTGRKRAWGNAVLGLRNAVAPPVVFRRDPDGRVWFDVELGAAYEGPAGLVHGGVSAMILDNLLGEAAEAAGKPGMTGTLNVRYRRPTPLGRVHGEARLDRVEGVKSWVKGAISDAEGEVCVEAEGVFILPRWAREASAQEAGSLTESG